MSVLSKPNPDRARLIAWEVFTAVQSGESYSHILLPQKLSESNFDSRDKGFITELVYGSLRMQGHADFVISQVSSRQLEDLDQDVLELLRLALYQVLHMRIPAHASVSANVELARKVLGESKGSFVNAVLRKAAIKDLDAWLALIQPEIDVDSRLAITTSHPKWIVSAYRDLLKDSDEVEKALVANNLAARPTLCVWPGSLSREEILIEGGELTHYSPYGVIASKPPSEYQAVRSHHIGVQDEGSQLVAHLFFHALHEPKTIVDACAGPGGKAALLSRLSSKTGTRFLANEISPIRAELVRNVLTYGDVMVGDAREIVGRFDGILADVPCTGLGALRRRPEVRWRRKLSDIKNLMPLQIEIAQRAIDNLNPGGILGYATCSPHLMETRSVIEALLRKNDDIEEIRVPFDGDAAHSGKALQLWTHRHQTDSMFLSLLRKVEAR